MTDRLPPITAREMVAALKRAGFVEHHQKGSHLVLKREKDNRRTLVAMHTGDLTRGIVKAILAQTGLSEDELRELL